MFELAPDSRHSFCLTYIIGRNNGGSSIQWSQKQKILTLGSGSLVGSAGRHLFIEHIGTSGPLFDAGCCSLDIETFKLQRVHAWGSGISQTRVYSNFPPSVVITETINWQHGSAGQVESNQVPAWGMGASHTCEESLVPCTAPPIEVFRRRCWGKAWSCSELKNPKMAIIVTVLLTMWMLEARLMGRGLEMKLIEVVPQNKYS